MLRVLRDNFTTRPSLSNGKQTNNLLWVKSEFKINFKIGATKLLCFLYHMIKRNFDWKSFKLDLLLLDANAIKASKVQIIKNINFFSIHFNPCICYSMSLSLFLCVSLCMYVSLYLYLSISFSPCVPLYMSLSMCLSLNVSF